MDKRIITRMLENCRESYHSIARELDVSAPTIKTRVDRLRMCGVIQRFSAEISHKTLGVEWILAELQAKKEDSKSALLNEFESNKCIGEVLMLGRGRYLVLAEAYPYERQELVSRLKAITDIEYIEISDIYPISNGMGTCKYTTTGERSYLRPDQIDILQYLRANARSSIRQIADRSGYSYKHVRKVIEQFMASSGVHLTLALNLPSCGHINVVLKSRLSDMTVDPVEVANWVACRYREEYWFSFFTPQADNVIHYMTVKQPTDIERMANEVIRHTQIDEIDAAIVYSALKSEGRTKCFLEKHASRRAERAQEASISMITQTGQVS